MSLGTHAGVGHRSVAASARGEELGMGVEADVRVEVIGPEGDSDEVAGLVQDLRRELLDLDVDSVTPAPVGPAPAGSKGIEMAAAAALLVQVKGSVVAVGAVIAGVRAWLARGRDQGLAVKVSIGEHTLELSRATPEQQEQLVQEFLRTLPRP
jgi:hypothetical protein